MSLLFAATCCSLVGGCASSTPATGADDTFFEPITSIERPPASRPETVPGGERSEWIARADSLQRVLNDQARRVDSLAGQIQMLQSSRVAALADTGQLSRNEPGRPIGSASGDRRDPSVSYDAALRIYESGRYQRAIEAFQLLLRRGIERDLEDNCRLWIDVCHFNLKQFDRAASALKQVAGWRGSDKRADALFMLGQIYEQLGNGR